MPALAFELPGRQAVLAAARRRSSPAPWSRSDLSPLPSWLVAAAGRLAAALAETVLVVAAAIYAIVSAFVPLRYAVEPCRRCCPPPLLIVTAVGYSLIIGGMTPGLEAHPDAPGRRSARWSWIFAISALPILTVPGWFTGLGRAFPVTGAVASLYDVLIAPPVTGCGTAA